MQKEKGSNLKRKYIMEDHNKLGKNRNYLQTMFKILKTPQEKKTVEDVDLLVRMWRKALGRPEHDTTNADRTGMSQAEIRELASCF